MQVQEQINRIRQVPRGFLPLRLLKELDLQDKAVVEALRKELAHLGQTPGGELPAIALYLLAQARDTPSSEVLFETLQGSGEDLAEALGDILENDLAPIMAVLFEKNLESLRRLGLDRATHDAFRASALEALLVLFAQGAIERSALLAYYHLLLDRVGQESSELMGMLAHCLSCIQDPELLELLDEAYREGWIDGWVLSREELESRYESLSEEKCLEQAAWSLGESLEQPFERLGDLGMFSRGQQTDRNHLCPCGSGKKFKVCCMRGA